MVPARWAALPVQLCSGGGVVARSVWSGCCCGRVVGLVVAELVGVVVAVVDGVVVADDVAEVVPEVDGVVVADDVAVVLAELVTEVVAEVVALVVGVVESHRRNPCGQMPSSASTNPRHIWLAADMQGPCVNCAHPSHSAKTSSSKHRRNPDRQVCWSSSANGVQTPSPS